MSVLAAVVLALLVDPVAADVNPPEWCRKHDFATYAAEPRLATVAGGAAERAHFVSDEDGCPSAEARCQRRAYLVTGDRVITSKARGTWVCSWFQPAKGSETVGWLPRARLSLAAVEARPDAARLVGRFVHHDNFIDIGPGLAVSGRALFHGNGGNVNTGEVTAKGTLEGHRVVVVEDECRLELRPAGPYLLVNDNDACGGFNVTFRGLYRRAR